MLFISPQTLPDRNHYLNFREEETEAQRGAIGLLQVTQLVGGRDGS